MNKLRTFLIFLIVIPTITFARGGDDVGNGGFAYKQSVIILKMAANALEEKIKTSTLKVIVDHPERRVILQDVLNFENIDKLSKKNQYRGGRKLAMNYTVSPPNVIVLKPYFESFMGKTDTELEDSSLEVQKRLLHEAAHIWGMGEDDAEKFAIAFLKNTNESMSRPNQDISFKTICSCLNGKSDITLSCDKFCAHKPRTSNAIFYAETEIGPKTSTHPYIKNLYEWCTVQLENDHSEPSCNLQATSGFDVINLPLNIKANSNIITANINILSKNKKWKLKIVENHSGNPAQTNETQITRVNQSTPGNELPSALRLDLINQYSCLNYGGKIDVNGNIYRTDYIKRYYYFPKNENPSPLPPYNTPEAFHVCHDEHVNPGYDSVLFDRLENVNDKFVIWQKSDNRFQRESNGKKVIDLIIENRLKDEYSINANLDLFSSLNYVTPLLSNNNLGFILKPFEDSYNGKSFCPKTSDFLGTDPLLVILGDYITNTEGIYISESEGQVLTNDQTMKTLYSHLLISESELIRYGFYVQNGLKLRASSDDLHSKTIHFYYPMNDEMGPLVEGNRKLFTIRSFNELNNSIFFSTEDYSTSDKRIGCIAKSEI